MKSVKIVMTDGTEIDGTVDDVSIEDGVKTIVLDTEYGLMEIIITE